MKEPIIYKIRNVVNQKFYVGSTWNKRERFRVHRSRLRRGAHHCKHLQAAWNKYGEDCFKFEVVERLPLDATPQDIEAAEDVWLIAHVGKPYCYNHGLNSNAPWRGCKPEDHPNYGVVLTEDQKRVLAEAAKKQWQTADPRTGKKHSSETKAKIKVKVQAALAEGRGGKFIPSEETRKKMSEALKGNQCAKGTKRSEREVELIRERMKGNKNWLGKKHSEESKAKMSKRILEVTTNTEFPSLTAAIEHYGFKMPLLQRALKSGKPVSRGKFTGLQFVYVANET